ncbi:DUF4145 domain-containing protein [Vibrio sp. SS-MA-C1-2]|uniref:DUF4145 domain-containing protein n=1 Tax=Vibrio sp. SS-MA-C1-2 TaxID=2908646 RepID=UPI001F1A6918|nr:DUF4145 domain-containing protein [Vibrio sp. SS-MA-C1-2]UJF19301.1 DUF4145 domain-containing protein [Vibrio sp. SS-MA-C1-2]
MAEIEMVVTKTRHLEFLLKEHYHAKGKGLHQLINSCEKRLPHDVIGKLRFIASVRNKVVHQDGYQLDNRKQFIAACDYCENILTPRAERLIWRVVFWLVVSLSLVGLWFYIQHWHLISFS